MHVVYSSILDRMHPHSRSFSVRLATISLISVSAFSTSFFLIAPGKKWEFEAELSPFLQEEYMPSNNSINFSQSQLYSLHLCKSALSCTFMDSNGSLCEHSIFKMISFIVFLQ